MIGARAAVYMLTGYTICVSLLSELGPEPIAGSPFTCHVSTPTPSAPHCILRGPALQAAIARKEETFEIQFRDATGQLAHAEDLDVFVTRVHVPAGQTADGGEGDAAGQSGPSDATSATGKKLTLASLRAVAFTHMPRVIDIWRALDRDKSGSLDKDEFVKGLSSAFPEATRGEMISVFRECDRDGNGSVDYLELATALNLKGLAGQTRARSGGNDSTPSQRPLGPHGYVPILGNKVECLVTSTKPLVVRASAELNSDKVGQLLPGQRLFLVEMVTMEDGGEASARALVCLAGDEAAPLPEAEKKEPGSDWREYTSHRPKFLDGIPTPRSPKRLPASRDANPLGSARSSNSSSRGSTPRSARSARGQSPFGSPFGAKVAKGGGSSSEAKGKGLTLASLRAVAFTAMPRVIDIWRALDRDRSGSIDLDEFVKGLRSAFPSATRKEMSALFKGKPQYTITQLSLSKTVWSWPMTVLLYAHSPRVCTLVWRRD